MNELPQPSLWREMRELNEQWRQWICQNKRAYLLPVQAQVAAISAMNHPNPKRRSRRKIYTYQCDVCGCWHLTKKTPKP